MSAAGSGLPLTIPAAGTTAVDLLLEGHLSPAAGGGAATPVAFTLLIDGTGGTSETIAGRFEDTLRQRRLGRRGSAVVHQLHTTVRRVVPNSSGGDLTVKHITLEPTSAQPVVLTAYAHPLPGPLVLVLATRCPS